MVMVNPEVAWGAMVRLKTWVAVAEVLSVTWMVKVEAPAALGVPEIVPVAERLRPLGNGPLVTDQV